MTPETRLDAEHFKLILEAAPVGMVAIGEAGQILFVNARAEKLFGYGRDELIGAKVERLLPSGSRDFHAALRSDYMRSPETRPMGVGRDLCAQRGDGTKFPVEIGLNPMQTNAGAMVIATVVDITERKRAEEQKDLLVGELDHRTKNLFAVMQAIAVQTLKPGRDVLEAQRVFTGKLMALARAYSILMDKAWTGAPLDELLGVELFSFSEKMNSAGPPILVRPAVVQSFALLFHELGTNSAKHGAFSNADGRVTVTWALKEDQCSFSLEWIESGGPQIAAPPTRTGYGHRLLDQIGRQLGRYDLHFQRDGLEYRLEAPLDHIGQLSPSV
jgi:PAS domain S-box-containing protein